MKTVTVSPAAAPAAAPLPDFFDKKLGLDALKAAPTVELDQPLLARMQKHFLENSRCLQIDLELTMVGLNRNPSKQYVDSALASYRKRLVEELADVDFFIRHSSDLWRKQG